ncbi:hypothetical protein AAFF_G00095440 [Aldrovandia affinis]|uniref:Uncharacterized protein n=1 Tax=Aldrovandia affinis TaxID=143900 RepID=A0AAD7R1I1_9TELE|nr:hypothetical protein AAFF_G00095440 [Aldrovandia affinis]
MQTNKSNKCGTVPHNAGHPRRQTSVYLSEVEKEQERDAERMIEQQRTTALTEQLGVTAVAGEDPVWMPEEVTGLSAEVPAAAPLERTPVSAIPLPCSPDRQREGETQEETLQERGAAPKKRRRQLLFIDKQIQIPHGELQEMIQDTLTETQPHLYHPELLSNPCTRESHCFPLPPATELRKAVQH